MQVTEYGRCGTFRQVLLEMINGYFLLRHGTGA
jgi:hypothetical protein